MRKRLRKSIAGIMALLMVLSNFQLTGLTAKAEGNDTEEKTYTMKQLGTPAQAWNVTATDISGGGQKLTFADNYKSIFYAVPAELDGAEITEITFNVESVSGIEGADHTWFGYKIFTADEYAEKAGGDGVGTNAYKNPIREVPADFVKSIKYLAITSANDGITGPIDMEISGVTFTVTKSASSGTVTDGNQSGDVTGGDNNGNTDEDESIEDDSSEEMPELTTKVTYNFIDLEKYNSWDVDMQVGKGGEATFAFAKQHGEAFFRLPQGIDASSVREIKLNVTSGSEGDLSLKLYDEVTTSYKEAIKFTYPGISIVPDEAFAGFGIMSINANGGSAKISGVTFTVADTLENVEIKKTYTFNDLAADKNGGVSANVDSTTGTVTYSYTDKWQEVFYAIPKEIDMEKVHKVTFNVSSGNANALAYKFYTADNYGGDWPSAPNEQVSYGNPSVKLVSGFAGMKYFGIMSQNPEEYSAVVDSVTFHTTGWGYSEAISEEGGNEDLIFTADEVTVEWSDTDYEQVEGKINMTFANQYKQIRIKLPQSIDMSNCESVEFVLADQTVPVTLKIWQNWDELWSKPDCSGAEKYVVVPNITDTISIIGIMYAGATVPTDAKASFVSVTFNMKEGASDVVLGDNIIINGDFADPDVSMWNSAQNNSVVSAEVADEAIFGDVKTYGKISRDPATAKTADAFVQDITENVEKGAEYQFEFYAMLSEEYANAPAEQRKVEFCPYLVIDGENKYLGTYSSELSGTSSQALEVGEWTKYSGTFTIPKGVEKVVIRIIEQGTEYGDETKGKCVKGDYYITGVSMKKIDKPIPEIEQDIPNWKDSLTEDLGVDTIAGTSLTEGEMSDDVLMELVTKHFNAVTPGNELKLDAMLNYSNDKCPENGTEIVIFNGEELEVPKLNHKRANTILDKLLEWNEANPDKQIKARGHVLVWHSQAPTWFFKENYDIDAAYVSKDVMDKRMEWYIKTMLEYYTGSDSKYKGLFYGWDVVNEAIDDGTNTYRSIAGNDYKSNWAAVYGDQSNEYIIKAFQYANKYAPANLELYYNDYNDCVPGKVQGIVKLLEAVLAAEGTRIDAMGMQAHHKMATPSVEEVEAAVRAYCDVVGKVQWTELDINASGTYDGTAATRDEVYANMAHRYKEYYDVLKKLDAEEGIDVTGITMWGVIDKNSWLHQQAGVAGGADGKQKQCPLLFDDNYKAKPSFWAFVDPSKLPAKLPTVKNIAVAQKMDDTYTSGMEYSMTQGDTKATFVPMWDENGLKVLVTVQDATVDATDAVTVYVDAAAKAGEVTPVAVTVKRTDAKEADGGYQAEVEVPLSSVGISKKVAMDVVIVNGTEKVAFNDTTFSQETSSKYYAIAAMKPIVTIAEGTITIDGEADDKWAEVEEIPLTINLGAKAESNIKMLWDKDYLYILAEVTDAELNKDSASEWLQDSIEVFIDENNKKTSSYDADDKQYRINYVNDQSFGSQKWDAEDLKSAAKITDDGYVIEAAFKWTDITPEDGTKIGLELQINDASKDADKGNPGRLGTLSWADDTGMGYAGSDVFGIAILVADEVEPEVTPSATPTPTPSVTPTPAPEVTPSPAPGETPSPSPETTPTPVPDADEILKEMVEELNVLVDDKATKEEKLQAVKDIIAEVKELVDNGNLEEVLEANVEYMEELFEKAIGRVLNVVNKDNKVPQIKKVIGALLGIELDKEAKMVFEAVTAPSLESKYKNAFAFDAKLFAGDKAVQPLVPVTIRMEVPSCIDKNGKVAVLHYADGAKTPERLAARIIDGMLEFTTSHFSTFVVVNEVEEQSSNNNGNANTGSSAPAATPAPTEAPAPVAGNGAPSTGDQANPMVAVVLMVLSVMAVAGVVVLRKTKKEEE